MLLDIIAYAIIAAAVAFAIWRIFFRKKQPDCASCSGCSKTGSCCDGCSGCPLHKA